MKCVDNYNIYTLLFHGRYNNVLNSCI